MNTGTKLSKEELLSRVKTARHIIVSQVASDKLRIESLWLEFRMFNLPLRVFNAAHNLWTRMGHLPFFSHPADDQLEFMEIQVSFLGLQAKRSLFEKRVTQMIEFRNFAVDALPNSLESLRELETPQLEQLASFLENDERIKNYLQCDIGKIREDWNKEKLLQLFEEIVHRMVEMMDVANEKLRKVVQAMTQV
ncbi:hypothetical protein Ocin01_13888 [Orchesella cincta]|uniref:Uncharacterized protein n=1 Tax=Orchesella cincta TaxID=48709 RepID=A0A1D2MJ15_ORCCI|nr:hypothetical protein Ocin01_13888 [Orchesella cincta]